MFKRWDKTLDLSDVWNNGDVPESEMCTLGKEIAKRIRCMYSAKFVMDNPELGEIIEMFEGICTVEDIESGEYCFDSVTEDFNARMYDLYEWADSDKRLCIITN